jgi:LacI family transcriptional regulator
VAIGAEPEDFRKWPERFPSPLVLIDRDAPGNSPDIYSVRSDEAQGMDIAIGHLHSRGCRRIGSVIHGRPGKGNTDARRDAALRALKARGLPAEEPLICLSGDDNYVEIIGKLLRQEVDALFCPGGNAGIVTAYALSLFNKRVPEDISLIASEYKMFSCYATPPQTTITQDHRALAGITADIMDAHINGTRAPRSVLLPYSLIVRESVARPKN